MKIFQILYDETVVGTAVDPSGDHSTDDALEAWNSANPSYAGDSARETDFVTLTKEANPTIFGRTLEEIRKEERK